MSFGPPSTFSLLPADSGLLSPDLELEAALLPTVNLGTPDKVPLGRGWAFDFLSGQFVKAGPTAAGVRGVDNLRVWIEKTLRTARFAHVIYGATYGMEEPNRLIGLPFDARSIGAYQQAIVEALTVHDRIAAVDGFFFQHDPSTEQLYVDFTVTLDAAASNRTIQMSSIPVAAVPS